MREGDDELVARAHARVGSVLRGKYRLDRVLGMGGMATVYAAAHRNGNEFAVKVLHADLSLRGELRTRFLREGHAANAVKHPGVVTVLDDDVTDDGAAFLVMELLQGESVEIFCERNQRLPLRLVAGIGLQLLDVLAAAHDKGVVHRDIKPGNLFVTTHGQVKVLDFGIARVRDIASSQATQTGTMMGTPAFMAPEQAMAKTSQIDAQTDVWAVGASLFTLASGNLVHPAENAQQIMIRAATRHAPPLVSVLPDAPPLLCEVVDRALSFEKADRWSGAAAMREALQNAARTSFGTVPTPEALAEALEELRNGATVVVSMPGVAMPGTAMPGARRPVVAPATEEATNPVAREPSPLPPRPRGLSLGLRARPAELVTAQPVSADSVFRRARASRFPQPRTFARGAMVAIAALSVLLVVIVTRSSSHAESDMATLAASVVQPIDVAPSATAPLDSADIPVPAEGLPIVPVDQLPSAAAPGTIRPAPVVPAAPPPAPKPSCNPPYTFDAQGNRKWKRECLR